MTSGFQTKKQKQKKGVTEGTIGVREEVDYRNAVLLYHRKYTFQKGIQKFSIHKII